MFNCKSCGAEFKETPDAGRQTAPENKKPWKTIAALSAAVAVLAVAAAYVVPQIGKSSSAKDNGLLYLKDNAIYHYDGKQTIELADRVLNEDEYIYGMYALYTVKFSEDGRYVYYFDKVSDYMEGTLYRKDLGKESEANDTTEQISRYVSDFRLSGDKLLYVKTEGENETLYLWTPKEEIKLASDVTVYRMSEDYNQIIWIDREGTLYYSDLEAGVTKEKIDDEVSSLSGGTKDLSRIYYVDSDDTLYCLNNFVKEKVASEVYVEGDFNEGGGVYYTVEGSSSGIPALYAYNGMENQFITENAVAIDDIWAYVEPGQGSFLNRLFIVASINGSDLSKIKLSENSSSPVFYNRLQQYVTEAPAGEFAVKILLNGTGIDIDTSFNDRYLYDHLNGTLYYGVTEKSGDEWIVTSIEKRTLSASGAGMAEVVDEDGLGEGSSYLTSQSVVYKGKLYYIADYDAERSEGVLRCEGKEIKDQAGNIIVRNNRLFIMSDVDDRTGTYTLSEYKNGSIEELVDDVNTFMVLSDGTIAALCEYRNRIFKRDLYLLKNGKKELLEEDVDYIYSNYQY